jgi:DNA invertase Pin-like site-specific DNA recombinase
MQRRGKNKTVAAYVRVSAVDQDEASQRAEIEQWLQANRIPLSTVTWYVDKGKTGDNLQRPKLKALQNAIHSGIIDMVVIYKLDRLSRSIQDGINTLAGWAKRGIRVVSVTQKDIDFNGAMGQFVAALLLGVAQMEQENRRERQKAGIALAKKQGKYKGRQAGTFKKDPSHALKLHQEGSSLNAIAHTMGVSRMTVRRYIAQAQDE